jgi:hypothetical protein
VQATNVHLLQVFALGRRSMGRALCNTRQCEPLRKAVPMYNSKILKQVYLEKPGVGGWEGRKLEAHKR